MMLHCSHMILTNLFCIVGVVGSGKGMTTYQQRGKHVYSLTDNE